MKKKSVFSLLLLFILGMFSNMNVCAEETYKDPKTYYMHFQQGDSHWANKCIGSSNITLGSSGCFVTSVAMIAAYADEDLRDVTKYNPDIATHQDSSKNGYIATMGGGGLAYSTFSIAPFKGLLKTNASYDAKAIKEALNKGHYVIMWSSNTSAGTHFSPIMGWDNDKDVPKVYDVYSATNTWGSTFNENSTWYEIEVQEGYEGFSFDMPTKFNGGASSSNSTKSDTKNLEQSQTAQEKEAMENTKTEWVLHGMPSQPKLVMDVNSVKIKDRSELNANDLNQIEDIKNSSKENSSYSYVRVAFSILGILLCVYSVVLLCALMFDRLNSFFDFSLVSVLSLGKLQLVKDPSEVIDTSARQSGLVSYRGVVLRAGVIFLVGVLFISGVLVSYVVRFVMWVMNL